jgi:Tfp pilus assembly protein FimV
VVFLVALVVALAAFLVLSGGSVATSEKGQPVPTEVVVVGEGDTLWAISSDIAAATGETDVRDVMADIEKLNGLDSGMLRAGQELRIPLVE